MVLRDVRFDGPWGTCVMAAMFAAFAGWYAYDSYSASAKIQNLLFIIPTAAAAVVVCLGLIVRSVPRLKLAKALPGGGVERIWSFKEDLAVPSYCLAAALYVALMPTIGFDVATALFVSAGMAIQGERRLWMLSAFPIVVALISVYAISKIMSFPVPSLVFG